MEQKGPTYILSDDYYEVVDRLAKETEQRLNQELEEIIHSFLAEGAIQTAQSLRSISEYSLELLYIGVLSRSYSLSEEGDGLGQLVTLSAWLGNTGEFDEITERLLAWISYWKRVGGFHQDFKKIQYEAVCFIKKAEELLYPCTKQIPEFIRKAADSYRDREDVILVTRSINEYYINMVGAQILNLVYRKEFKQADRVYIFVPGCMAARFDQCQAEKSDMGYTCIGCTPDCPIYKTTCLGQHYQAETVIVYHSSALYHTRVSKNNGKYGVVGIACVLNLISGGLKARDLGYVPQCVVLNYCGCRQHWSREGLVTDINRERLEETLSAREYRTLN